MTTISFDTKELVVELENCGFTRQQSELSTKRDIEDVRLDMRELEQRLIIKLGTLIGFAIGVVAILVKLL